MNEIQTLRLELDTVVRHCCAVRRITRSSKERILSLATKICRLVIAGRVEAQIAADPRDALQAALDRAAEAGMGPQDLASMRWKGHSLDLVVGGDR